MVRRSVLGVFVLLGGLGGVAVAGPAGADPGSTTSAVAAVSTADQNRVTGYWTGERMGKAVPVDQLVGMRWTTPSAVPAGQPATVAPSAARTGAAGGIGTLAFPNGGSAWGGGGAVTRTAGRVFFTMAGRDASCSGDAVTSSNRSVVLTAGHCVKYQGAWHTNWVFVPGYNNGNRPYGTWTARLTMATPQWVASEDLNFDVGAAVVNQLNGASLTDVVGGQGVAFNQARRQAMYAFGYPAAAPYNGSQLIYCSGTAIDDFLLSRDHGLTCNMTGGSSGGPWFLSFNEATGTGLQASVNSFKYNFFPWMFGPYFGTDAQNLYNTAQSS